MHRGQGRVQSVLLDNGSLFVQTSRATLEAIDAETGQKLWAKLVGQSNYPTMQAGACGDLVATINGSRLFVMNRYTGDILYEEAQSSARPGGGPAVEHEAGHNMCRFRVRRYLFLSPAEPVTDPSKELGKIDPNAADAMTDEEKQRAASEGRGGAPPEHPPSPGLHSAAGLRVERPCPGAADCHDAEPR